MFGSNVSCTSGLTSHLPTMVPCEAGGKDRRAGPHSVAPPPPPHHDIKPHLNCAVNDTDTMEGRLSLLPPTHQFLGALVLYVNGPSAFQVSSKYTLRVIQSKKKLANKNTPKFRKLFSKIGPKFSEISPNFSEVKSAPNFWTLPQNFRKPAQIFRKLAPHFLKAAQNFPPFCHFFLQMKLAQVFREWAQHIGKFAQIFGNLVQNVGNVRNEIAPKFSEVSQKIWETGPHFLETGTFGHHPKLFSRSVNKFGPQTIGLKIFGASRFFLQIRPKFFRKERWPTLFGNWPETFGDNGPIFWEMGPKVSSKLAQFFFGFGPNFWKLN